MCKILDAFTTSPSEFTFWSIFLDSPTSYNQLPRAAEPFGIPVIIWYSNQVCVMHRCSELVGGGLSQHRPRLPTPLTATEHYGKNVLKILTPLVGIAWVLGFGLCGAFGTGFGGMWLSLVFWGFCRFWERIYQGFGVSL